MQHWKYKNIDLMTYTEVISKSVSIYVQHYDIKCENLNKQMIFRGKKWALLIHGKVGNLDRWITKENGENVQDGGQQGLGSGWFHRGSYTLQEGSLYI